MAKDTAEAPVIKHLRTLSGLSGNITHQSVVCRP